MSKVTDEDLVSEKEDEGVPDQNDDRAVLESHTNKQLQKMLKEAGIPAKEYKNFSKAKLIDLILKKL